MAITFYSFAFGFALRKTDVKDGVSFSCLALALERIINN